MKSHLILSVILFASISISFFSYNEVFAEIDANKLIYSKGIVKISGKIVQLDTNSINILETEITDSDNNIVANEYTPLNDDSKFFSSYDTITWKTENYKVTINNNNNTEESIEFEIRT